MKTFRLDCEFKAWLRCIEIDAETEEEAINKLYKMTADELLEAAFVDEFTTEDVGCEKIYDWDEEEEDDDDSLPEDVNPNDFPPPPPWLW